MHFLQGHASVAQPTPTLFEARQQRENAQHHSAAKAVHPSKDKALPKPQQSRQSGSVVADFNFYQTLPKMQLEVYAQPLPVKLSQPVRILAGTFTTYERAMRERDRLKKLGFDLQLVRLQRNGRQLYQLRSTEISDRLALIRMRNRLQKAGARVLVVRLKAQSQP
jgi:hypothetical protein